MFDFLDIPSTDDDPTEWMATDADHEEDDDELDALIASFDQPQA